MQNDGTGSAGDSRCPCQWDEKARGMPAINGPMNHDFADCKDDGFP